MAQVGVRAVALGGGRAALIWQQAWPGGDQPGLVLQELHWDAAAGELSVESERVLSRPIALPRRGALAAWGADGALLWGAELSRNDGAGAWVDVRWGLDVDPLPVRTPVGEP